MLVDLNQEKIDFILTLLVEEKARLYDKFRRKSQLNIAERSCNIRNSLIKIGEIIESLGEING
jgi:hypothetical protein